MILDFFFCVIFLFSNALERVEEGLAASRDLCPTYVLLYVRHFVFEQYSFPFEASDILP